MSRSLIARDDSSVPEEIPHASTLALPELEALLAQQEACSRDVLGSALAKKQQAERLIEQASRAEDEAQTLRVRYEQTEKVIQELRGLIVDRNKETLEKQFDTTSHGRASLKRPYPADESSNVARKRLASETTIKREQSPSGSPPPSDHAEAASHVGVPNPQVLRRTQARDVLLPNKQSTLRGIFAHTHENHPLRHTLNATGFARMVRYDNPEDILIYISGQCTREYRSGMKRAGCAVIFETEGPFNKPNSVAFSIEKKGPDGRKQRRNDLNAAIRAVVAALELKLWSSEGWKQVTIATDSKPLYDGITDHISTWVANGWFDETPPSKAPQRQLWKRQLWGRALDLINEQERHGCKVRFWLINAEQNQEAARRARAAAPVGSASETYRPCGDVGLTFVKEETE